MIGNRCSYQIVGIQLYIETETIKMPLLQIDLSCPLISFYNSFFFLFDQTLTPTQRPHEAEKYFEGIKG